MGEFGRIGGLIVSEAYREMFSSWGTSPGTAIRGSRVFIICWFFLWTVFKKTVDDQRLRIRVALAMLLKKKTE
jgi:hypothetical protein